jgi:hypothetical protein
MLVAFNYQERDEMTKILFCINQQAMMKQIGETVLNHDKLKSTAGEFFDISHATLASVCTYTRYILICSIYNFRTPPLNERIRFLGYFRH